MFTRLLKKVLIWLNRKVGVNMSKNTLSTPLLIANTLLDRAFSENEPITHLKLQKLIYFVYKRFLKETDKSLFDEYFEVWTHGPVLPSIYDEFKRYAAEDISDYVYSECDDIVRIIASENTDFHAALNWVWENYGRQSPTRLRNLTHEDGTAWQRTKEEGKLYISDDFIIEEKWVIP